LRCLCNSAQFSFSFWPVWLPGSQLLYFTWSAVKREMCRKQLSV